MDVELHKQSMQVKAAVLGINSSLIFFVSAKNSYKEFNTGAKTAALFPSNELV